MSAPVYGKTISLWRSGCPEAWRAFTRHAFVEGLRDGTLPRSAYLHYLIQDYVFLVHFSRAWSLGVIKADTLDEMKTCARTVDALVNHEMDLHIQTCAAEGIDEEKLFNASEELENLAYTRYVMDAGVRGDFLDLLAALAPCCFGYGEIGARLAQSASAGTPYRDWINAYGSEDYQSVMQDVAGMIDQAVARRLGKNPDQSARWKHLQRHFTTAAELEVRFWDMGLRAG